MHQARRAIATVGKAAKASRAWGFCGDEFSEAGARPLAAASGAAETLRKLKRATGVACDLGELEPVGGAFDRREAVASSLFVITREARLALLPERFRTIERDFDFLLRYLTTTSTIEEAIGSIADFGARYWFGLATIWIEQSDGRVAIRCRSASDDRNKVFVHELRSVALTLGYLDWLSGGRLTGLRAEFLQAPLAVDEIRQLFPYDVSTGDVATGVILRAEDLKKPVMRTPQEVADWVAGASMIAVGGREDRKSCHAEVQAVVERELHFHGRAPSLEDVSDYLLTSPATLHRRLKAEGASFREVRDETLNTVARRLLVDTTTSISSISERLGYSEERPFRRSFRRWNGCSPAEFRAGRQGAPPTGDGETMIRAPR